MRKPIARALIAAALLAGTVAFAAPGAGAHPDPLDRNHKDDHASGGLGLLVSSPADLAGMLEGVQWSGTAAVADQAGDLVYAGTGCTVASYAPVAAAVRGNIALIDSRASASNPADQCPAYTFAQKVAAAEAAGAAGLVQITGEGEEPTEGSALVGSMPALEIARTDRSLAIRDAVIGGTAVSGTLTDTRVLDAVSNVPCVDGRAGIFECDGVDLLSFVPQSEFNGAGISDLWGWTDAETGDEYVIIGKTNGTAFFRVTDPTAPVYLGELPNPAIRQEIWHDMKVFQDHAFIVSESEPHGMSVFDLTRLRDVTEAQEWDRDAFYPLNSAAHNIAINEDTGFAYIVGGNIGLVGPDQCLSGLHIVDINDPKNPTFAGCHAADGGPGTGARTVGEPVTEVSPVAYVHDTQCVIYEGPDTRYTGRELCFNASEDKVVIVDVTDKAATVTVGIAEYPNSAYTHQGWLTEDQAYFIANDELDEQDHGLNTRSVVFDVRDLENPKVHFEHLHETTSIDHNNYVKGSLVFQSNYTSGLRVLDASAIADPANPRLEQKAFFDTYPWHSDPTFNGTWSNYPYFDSGTIAVSGIDEGLFLLRLADDSTAAAAGAVGAAAKAHAHTLRYDRAS